MRKVALYTALFSIFFIRLITAQTGGGSLHTGPLTNPASTTTTSTSGGWTDNNPHVQVADTTDKVGIGISGTAADGKLHVHSGTAGTVTAGANSDEIVVENSTHGGISILTPTASEGTLVFGVAGDNISAFIDNLHSTGIFRIGTHNANGYIAFETGTAVEAMRITTGGNIGINTSTFDGTADNVIAVANGTAPAAGTANQSYIYAKDAAASSEIYMMDEAGNETIQTPHDPEILANSDPNEPVPFTYSSRNIYVGKQISIDMTAVIREVERLSGKTFITVTDIPINDKVDWTDNQEAIRVLCQNQIDAANNRIASLDAEIAAISNEMMVRENELLVADNKETARLKKLNEIDSRKILDLEEKKSIVNIPATYKKKRPPKWLRDRGVDLMP